MHHDHPVHVDRYIPAQTNGGWRAAIATIVLALVCIAGATVVHLRTYKPPTDPTWRAAGQRGAEAGHHGTPNAAHGAPAPHGASAGPAKAH